MPAAVLYICVTLLFLGAAPLPYGYYTLLRLVGCGVFVFAVIVARERKNQVLPWVYGLLAVLFNPFFKIHLPKEVWIFVDVGVGILILITAKSIVTKPGITRGSNDDELQDKREQNFNEPIQTEKSSLVLQQQVTLDGRDFDHAIPVSSVEEEYAWIKDNIPAAKRTTQAVYSCRNGLVDVLEIELEDGSKQKVYFDISQILVKWARARDQTSRSEKAPDT